MVELLLEGYLPLNEYSAKYRISLSTLRRRIRSGDIEYRFEAGKYWLAERPPTKYGHVMSEKAMESNHPNQSLNEAAMAPEGPTLQATDVLLDSAKRMMQELKSAYVSVLQEKEKQITELKEEVSDLKTLVTILEAENERLNLSR